MDDTNNEQNGKGELVVINELTTFPEPDGLTKILKAIEERIKNLVFDMSDPKSRAACKSTAFEVTKDKTYLVGLGKQSIADKKAAVKMAEAEIKRAENHLTELAKKVREPLTLWEEAEGKRKKEEKEYADAWDAAIIENNQFDIRKKQEAEDARLAEERKIFEAQKAETDRKQKEESDRLAKEKADLQAEKDRLAKEEADRKAAAEKAERETRIREEAKAKAEKEAQEKIEHERASAEQKRLADIKAAEIKAEAEKQAILDAQKEKERQEAERVAKEKAEADRIKAENDKRAADEAHRAKIIENIKDALSDIFSEHDSTETRINGIVCAIIDGGIPHVSINFAGTFADF